MEEYIDSGNRKKLFFKIIFMHAEADFALT